MLKRPAAFAVALLAGLGIVGVATPALASYSACPTNSICVYTNGGGTGTVCIFNASTVNANSGQSLAGTSCNNNATSISNHQGLSLRLFDPAHCAATSFHTTPPENVSDFTGTTWNDKLSSFQIEPDYGDAC